MNGPNEPQARIDHIVTDIRYLHPTHDNLYAVLLAVEQMAHSMVIEEGVKDHLLEALGLMEYADRCYEETRNAA